MTRLFPWMLALSLLLSACTAFAAENRFTALSYHDVVDTPAGDANPLSTSVSTAEVGRYNIPMGELRAARDNRVVTVHFDRRGRIVHLTPDVPAT
jgi:hypothetical protein